MSGDRLAEIEELRRSGQLGAITVSDVLALVEIAKAARGIDDEFMGHEELEPLRSALARLDRPSSDGTTDSGAAE